MAKTSFFGTARDWRPRPRPKPRPKQISNAHKKKLRPLIQKVMRISSVYNFDEKLWFQPRVRIRKFWGGGGTPPPRTSNNSQYIYIERWMVWLSTPGSTAARLRWPGNPPAAVAAANRLRRLEATACSGCATACGGCAAACGGCGAACGGKTFKRPYLSQKCQKPQT